MTELTNIIRNAMLEIIILIVINLPAPYGIMSPYPTVANVTIQKYSKSK
jgi:hypothetical protein